MSLSRVKSDSFGLSEGKGADRCVRTHRMASETDPRLVASVELVNIRVRVSEHLGPLHGKVDAQTISFVKRIFSDLQDWYHEWHQIHRQKFEEQTVLVQILEVELVYAQLWTVCVALRGCQWDKVCQEFLEFTHGVRGQANST